MKRSVGLVAVLLSFVLCTISFAEEFRAPEGFTINYPAGWLAISKSTNTKDIPAEVAEWMTKSKVERGSASVLFIHPTNDDFMEYAKVAATSYKPINNFTLTNLVGNSQEDFGGRGMTADIWEARIKDVGGAKAMVLDYKVRSAAISDPLHVRQYYFSKNNSTYVVTCTAKWSSWGSSAAAFEGIAASLKW
jgi:hypothetical protein